MIEKKMTRGVSVGALAALLSACGHLPIAEPAFEAMAAKRAGMPTDWTVAPMTGDPAAVISDYSVFQDAQLVAYVQEALENNRTLRAAIESVRQSEAVAAADALAPVPAGQRIARRQLDVRRRSTSTSTTRPIRSRCSAALQRRHHGRPQRLDPGVGRRPALDRSRLRADPPPDRSPGRPRLLHRDRTAASSSTSTASRSIASARPSASRRPASTPARSRATNWCWANPASRRPKTSILAIAKPRCAPPCARLNWRSAASRRTS